MKSLILFITLMTSAFGQDPVDYLKNFDGKIYSLKTKGVKDFVVDIESTKLTKQINDQQLFGKVSELIFRVYWTGNPERLAIEIQGLPPGFTEVKEQLKAGMMTLIEDLVPQAMALKFKGYKFSQGPKQREITATDISGIAAIPSFTLKFDEQDRMIEVIGNKPVGNFNVKPVYEKVSFADGKWVLTEQMTSSSEGGQSLVVTKKLNYGKVNGLSVLTEINVTTEQKNSTNKPESQSTTDTIEFKNYKINEGDGLKYFLSESE